MIKIANTLLDHQQMHAGVQESMMDHIQENVGDFSYEVLAEIAVIYASKMDVTYKKMFFDKMRLKFLKELEYLKDETLYKILWSFFKANAMTINRKNKDWEAVKEIIAKKSKDINP